MKEQIDFSDSFKVLKQYCEREDFKGWDPYDGLNSKLFQCLPLISKNRLFRLAWIQLFKRNPINLRSITGVAKDYNPKGLGLFISGYCNLYKLDPNPKCLEIIRYLADKVCLHKSMGYSGSCWGYNFDWQSRAFFQPKFTPTIVATTFIAWALMDAYEITGECKYLDTALSSKDFILKDLNRTYDDEGDFAFSYSPKDHTQVFNASLLGSRLLARIYFYTKDPLLKEMAKKSVAYCCKHQKKDGSWSYGTLPFHQWTDNFHTGYNLECLHAYQYYTLDNTYQEQIEKGFQYYIKTFFTEEGIPKYYNNQMYPIDVHATSQLVITLSKMGRFNTYKPLIDKVLLWTIMNMQDKRGFFYYQLKKNINSRIPYMRWAQAWMFVAFSEYFANTDVLRTKQK